jgi:hypothetical protein
MWLIVAYVALMVYGAGLFIYAVTHERPWAAIGILLSMTGVQFALLNTLADAVAIGVAVSGVILVGRDVYLALAPRAAMMLVRGGAFDRS